MVGLIQRGCGRPEIVYGRKCPRDKIEHEVRVADVGLHFFDSPMTRDTKVNRAVPDGVMIIENKRCFVEVDCSGNMSFKQMQAKWRRYGKLRDEEVILVIATSEKRMERLRRDAVLVKDVALFSTFDNLGTWIDHQGNTIEL